jgi:hypothetical protein
MIDAIENLFKLCQTHSIVDYGTQLSILMSKLQWPDLLKAMLFYFGLKPPVKKTLGALAVPFVYSQMYARAV